MSVNGIVNGTSMMSGGKKFWEGDVDLPISNTGDPNSFGYYTSRERWPSIMQNVINDVKESIELETEEEIVDEGKKVVQALEKLREEVKNDAALEPLDTEIDPTIQAWNSELASFGPKTTYLSGPWLYVECYMYRRIQNILSRTKHWQKHDVFKRQKDSTFKKSKKAICELANRYRSLVQECQDGLENREVRKLLFIEMIEISLWGNATDLSLLATLKFEDLERLQGKKAILEQQKNIVVNDMEKVFDYFDTLKGAQIDIVLDNAGFELFVDVFLASYMLEIGAAAQITCHPKNFGWFVSDVLPADFTSLFSLLQDPSIADTPEHHEDLKFLQERWLKFYETGRIKIRTDEFWTTSHPYWRMERYAPELYKVLQKSDLVVYKGDLNYRKLVEDAWWPKTTKFVDALGPIGRGSGIKTLALRTSKADCFVGLESEEQVTEIVKRGGETWSRSGKFALVSFHNGE